MKKEITAKEYDEILNDTNRDYIAITFDGHIYLHCTGHEARMIQTKSGGCIRNHQESLEDLRKAFKDTISTFPENAEDVEKHMKDFDEFFKYRDGM
jgi:hypothetical protein